MILFGGYRKAGKQLLLIGISVADRRHSDLRPVTGFRFSDRGSMTSYANPYQYRPMITTADINLGTRFGGEVDVPFDVKHISNDLQMALGRIRGTAIIDTEHTVRINDETHWDYRFVINGTNQQVTLERLKLPEGADSMAFTDLETLDVEEVTRGEIVEEYERTLAHLMRRTAIKENDGLTTTQGDGILSAVFERYGEYPNEEISRTEAVPFESYEAIEHHFTRADVRQLWHELTDIEGIGTARATNVILLNKASTLANLRDGVDHEQWESISSEIDVDIDDQ